MSEIRLFVNHIDEKIDDFILSLNCGRIHSDGHIGDGQIGAKKTFAVGMPMFTIDGEYLGRLGIGLYEGLDYAQRDEIGNVPVHFWRVENYKSGETDHKKVITYYQWKRRQENGRN